MSREKRLGRGLEALLGEIAASDENTLNESNVALAEAPMTEDGAYLDEPQNDTDRILQEKFKDRVPNKIDILLIDKNPLQPRTHFDSDELEKLTGSILAHGMIQAIAVRKHGDRYQIISGERRYRAAVRAGWSEVPVHILDVNDQKMAELALTENIQRTDLNAMEKATAFAGYIEMYGGSQEELATRLGMDRSTVANLIRLLDLPEEIQTMVRKEELSQGHARALLSLNAWEQLEFAKRIIAESWSVRQTERAVKEFIETGDRSENPEAWNVIDQDGNRKTTPVNEHLAALEQEFRYQLGTKVKLSQSDKGKGKLVISFASHDEFDYIYKLICRNKNGKIKDVG